MAEDLHLSTLIQQLLSLIAQHGGVLAAEAFSVLCGEGPFGRVGKSQFADLLRNLGSTDILMQAPDGTLLLGVAGERIVNHYSFYAAFKSVEEWRMVHEGRALGTMPVNFSLAPDALFSLAGGGV